MVTETKRSCPLCKKLMSLYQIDVAKAIYMCDDTACDYPLGPNCGIPCVEVPRSFKDIEKPLDADYDVEWTEQDWQNFVYIRKIANISESTVKCKQGKQQAPAAGEVFTHAPLSSSAAALRTKKNKALSNRFIGPDLRHKDNREKQGPEVPRKPKISSEPKLESLLALPEPPPFQEPDSGGQEPGSQFQGDTQGAPEESSFPMDFLDVCLKGAPMDTAVDEDFDSFLDSLI